MSALLSGLVLGFVIPMNLFPMPQDAAGPADVPAAGAEQPSTLFGDEEPSSLGSRNPALPIEARFFRVNASKSRYTINEHALVGGDQVFAS